MATTSIDKATVIANYKRATEEFSRLVVPSDDTPYPLAAHLTQTYNAYVEWFKSIEAYARQMGWYEELQ